MDTAVSSHPPHLLKQLRLATAEQHRNLDGALNIKNPALDRCAYLELLKGFYGLHAAWEPRATAQFNSVIPGFYDRRRKLHLLEQDLMALGLTHDSIAEVPVCEELACLTSFSAALGTAYVLEGSTLGGQILSRHFARSLGIGPNDGGSYFHGYGDKTGEMWREFGQMMESYAALTAIHEEVLEGAKRTFLIVHEWLLGRDE